MQLSSTMDPIMSFQSGSLLNAPVPSSSFSKDRTGRKKIENGWNINRNQYSLPFWPVISPDVIIFSIKFIAPKDGGGRVSQTRRKDVLPVPEYYYPPKLFVFLPLYLISKTISRSTGCTSFLSRFISRAINGLMDMDGCLSHWLSGRDIAN